MSNIDVGAYFEAVKAKHATGQATEHSYRPALEKLLKSINPSLTVINEPRRIACGSPDFVIMRGDVPVGYVEAKDVGLDIRKMKGPNKAQQERYRDGLANLIYTNGLDFDFYRHDGSGKSQRVAEESIGDYLMGLQPKTQRFATLESLLYDFVSQNNQAQTITSSNRLAKVMAGKAKLIRDALGKALVADEDDESDLAAQYVGFRDTLIHDITKATFADIYAETIVYGMFAARYHDPTPQNFSRQEALELLPKSNPFLRKLFTFIAATDLDEGIRWIIDDLAQIFQATRVDLIMQRWSDANDRRDPFLHFYETFLAEYNPAKRKSRGVWYTPEAVVNFIVRAVDDVLKKEFGEPMGLASTTKITVPVKTGTKEVGRKGKKRREDVIENQEMHRVQILDPATGTGTFLAEVIRQIEPRIKAVDEGGWTNYVERDLKPRLHGFELLMASYAMCHLKLDMMLTETGYKAPKKPKRLSVWLTNSLEEPQEDDNSLPLFGLARAINEEAQGANAVKRDKPIMCIIGNPPYSGESSNKGQWIMDLMQAYKKEPGGVEKLKERNPKWINDDYVKFIRFAEHMIAENGEGILGFITNHGYLDNPTFRGMRWQLLKTFDKIYVLDLHGNAKKKEVAPDGSKDENVFDIQQGVAIIIGIKFKNSDADLAVIRHDDLWGKRNTKYERLYELSNVNELQNLLPHRSPNHPMVSRDYELEDRYLNGFGLKTLMPKTSMGVMTKRDKITISFDESDVRQKVKNFSGLQRIELEKIYDGIHDARDWHLEGIKDNINICGPDNIKSILYRPFDYRRTYYTNYSRGYLAYPVFEIGRHLLEKNFCLTTIRKADVAQDWSHILAVDGIMVHHGSSCSNHERRELYVSPLPLS